MMRNGSVMSWIAIGLFATSCATIPPPQPAPPRPVGLTVEEAGKGSSPAKAGIQAGDVLLSWRAGEAQGELTSPFQLQKFFREEVPRGDAQLVIRRGDVESIVTLPPGYLTGVYRPGMPRDVEPSYLEAKKKIDAKDLE